MPSYYYAKKRAAEPAARDTRDAMLKEKIMQVWKGEQGREVYGARKTWLELNRQGIVVARCTVERLMRDLGIHGARGRRKRPRTTVPGDPAGMPQDLLERGSMNRAESPLGGGNHVRARRRRGFRVYRVRDGPVRPPHSGLAGH